jgi:hypothetical protein
MSNKIQLSESSLADISKDRIYKAIVAVSPLESNPDSFTGLFWECQNWLESREQSLGYDFYDDLLVSGLVSVLEVGA